MSYTLGQGNALPWQHLRYSFDREEHIHPLIVQELLGWLSDAGQPITSVDIALANRSNRFHGDFTFERCDGRTWVHWRGSEGEYFCYSFIAASLSGVQMIECYDCGGGSGVFGSVGLFSFEGDRCLSSDSEDPLTARNRVILKIIGSITPRRSV